MRSSKSQRDAKPKCPECGKPLGMFTRGRFCSDRCKATYLETVTRLAVERLNASVPQPRAKESREAPATIVLRPETQT